MLDVDPQTQASRNSCPPTLWELSATSATLPRLENLIGGGDGDGGSSLLLGTEGVKQPSESTAAAVYTRCSRAWRLSSSTPACLDVSVAVLVPTAACAVLLCSINDTQRSNLMLL